MSHRTDHALAVNFLRRPIPEPAAFILLALGGVLLRRRPGAARTAKIAGPKRRAKV